MIEAKEVLRKALLLRMGGDAAVVVSHLPAQAAYLVSLSKSAIVPYEKVTPRALLDGEFLDGIPEDVQ